jgi:hypothetical protein
MFSLRGHKAPLVKHKSTIVSKSLNLKTMKKYIFFSVLIALSFAACNPTPTPVDPTTKVEGRLMDRGTNIPITNTVVKLVEVTGNFLGNPERKVIQSVTTDDKGQYAFTYQWSDLKTYDLNSSPSDLDKYYSQPKVVGEFKQGQTNKVDCFLYPYGWVKYRIRNMNPFDDRDTIRCLAGVFTGKNVDKTVVVKQLKLWEQPDSSFWSVTRNNVWTRYSKPIALVPKDTINYEINY